MSPAASVQNVATISAGNDEAIGEMIADALDKVGSNGVLSIETSNSTETFVEVQEGMEIDRGYLSPQFVTNQERLLVEFDNCCVLVTDQKVRGAHRGSVCRFGCTVLWLKASSLEMDSAASWLCTSFVRCILLAQQCNACGTVAVCMCA
jgi:hypothetical protein